MLRIRPLTAADIPLGLRLTSQAGWNQTAADWRRCLDLEPEGCFAAEMDGVFAGTTTTCTFGSVAWIALVLVDAAVRRRGIGGALVKHALAWLETRGVRSIWLDATPLGQPVYERLGFEPEFALCRFHGRPSAVQPHFDLAQHVDPASLDARHAAACSLLDRSIMGTDRTKLLVRLFADCPQHAHVVLHGGEVRGFIAARHGAQAVQVGPCLGDRQAGPALLAGAWRALAGRMVFTDIPEANREAAQLAESAGLTVQRQLLRMRQGDRLACDLAGLWASSGPEKG